MARKLGRRRPWANSPSRGVQDDSVGRWQAGRDAQGIRHSTGKEMDRKLGGRLSTEGVQGVGEEDDEHPEALGDHGEGRPVRTVQAGVSGINVRCGHVAREEDMTASS